MAKWTPVAKMRRRITIESIAATPTSGGETTDTPSTTLTAWAKIEPMGGKEMFLAGVQQDTSIHKVNMLYQPGVSPLMRIKFGSRYLNITTVNDLEEQHRELEITATEVLG